MYTLWSRGVINSLGFHDIFTTRWRSSLWKLIWKELLVYTVAFLLISLVYRNVLEEEQRKEMEELIVWCRHKLTGSRAVSTDFCLGELQKVPRTVIFG